MLTCLVMLASRKKNIYKRVFCHLILDIFFVAFLFGMGMEGGGEAFITSEGATKKDLKLHPSNIEMAHV